MPFTLYMPKLSPTMESGTIVAWHKKEGDEVAVGDLLFEVATDKATVEYNAIDSGFIAKVLVMENGEAVVNQSIAIMTEEKGENIEGYTPKNLLDNSLKQEAKDNLVTPQINTNLPPLPPVTEALTKQERLLASPLAKKIAKEKNLNISGIKGTGPGGRIMSRDLSNAPEGIKDSNKSLPNIAPGSYVEEALTPIRKVISQRLQESKMTIPHFYVQQTIDAENLVDLRNQLKSLHKNISFNDFVVKAAAEILKNHPIINSGFNSQNNSILRYQTVDVAVAVSIPSGLITPIVRFTDHKSLQDISLEIKELAIRAKEGKLAPHEYQGGSFTISNLGMYGVTNFQAIINPPQAAILAVSGILDVPVVKEGKVVPGKVMNLCLSVDHRVIDGVAAAEFMKDLQKLLENPIGLLVNL